ncbi:MAG: hypothetical protein PUH24_06710 [Prevotellaceae bacterium]|nr:hypothetical protein [Prevotellaceae bacterium]MDY6129849.1 hypothetical protein [Prevotella sp.]
MKTILSFMLLALSSGAAAEELSDTTFHVKDKKIVVDVDCDKTRIQVYNAHGDELTKAYESEYVDGQEIERIYVGSPFIPKSKNKPFDSTIPTLFFGLGLHTNDPWGDNRHSTTIHTNNSRSWEWGLSPFHGTAALNRQKTWGVMTALQIKFSNIHIDRNFVMDGTNELTPYNGPKLEKNYLHYFSVNAPLMLGWQEKLWEHKFYLGLGLSAEWRPNLHSKYRYTAENGDNVKHDTKIPLNHWGINLECHIGYGSVVLFSRVALTPLYTLKNGHSAYPVSIGIGLR